MKQWNTVPLVSMVFSLELALYLLLFLNWIFLCTNKFFNLLMGKRFFSFSIFLIKLKFAQKTLLELFSLLLWLIN